MFLETQLAHISTGRPIDSANPKLDAREWNLINTGGTEE